MGCTDADGRASVSRAGNRSVADGGSTDEAPRQRAATGGVAAGRAGGAAAGADGQPGRPPDGRTGTRGAAGLNSAEQAAVNAAKQETINIQTYRLKSFDADFSAALAGLTAAKATQWQANKSTLKSKLTSQKIDSGATVSGAGLVSFDGKSAVVVVASDTQRIDADRQVHHRGAEPVPGHHAAGRRQVADGRPAVGVAVMTDRPEPATEIGDPDRTEQTEAERHRARSPTSPAGPRPGPSPTSRARRAAAAGGRRRPPPRLVGRRRRRGRPTGPDAPSRPAPAANAAGRRGATDTKPAGGQATNRRHDRRRPRRPSPTGSGPESPRWLAALLAVLALLLAGGHVRWLVIAQPWPGRLGRPARPGAVGGQVRGRR